MHNFLARVVQSTDQVLDPIIGTTNATGTQLQQYCYFNL